MLSHTVLLAQLLPHDVETVLSIGGGLLLIAVFLVVFLGLPLVPFLIWRGRVRRRGYPGLMAYLRELPQTEEQRLDAVELTLKGAAICMLGLLFPPIVVYGLVPLYYGARKLAAIRLGIPGAKSDGHDELSP
jgi:hypothetical protein